MLRAVFCALKQTSKAQPGSRSVFGSICSSKKATTNNITIFTSHKISIDSSLAFYTVNRRKLRTKVTKLNKEKAKTAAPTPAKNAPVVKDAFHYYDKAKNLGNKFRKIVGRFR